MNECKNGVNEVSVMRRDGLPFPSLMPWQAAVDWRIRTLNRDFCDSLQSLIVDENICDSNEPFELHAQNLCENFTERDYWGVLLDKHLRRGQLIPRSDLIKPSFKETSSCGVSFVFFFCSSLCHHRWYKKDVRWENSDFATAIVWSLPTSIRCYYASTNDTLI